MIAASQSELTVVIPDIHCPNHDQKAVATAIEFVAHLKPKHLIFLGDVFDFYAMSRFDKDPKRALRLDQDIRIGKEVLAEFCNAAPKAAKHFIEGNHERRLLRYTWKHPELSSLEVFQPENFLGLRELGIRWHPEEETFVHHGVVVTHGTRVSKWASYSAKAELEKWGTSGVSGHTHRLGSYYHSTFGADHVWSEAGCLCDLNPEYVIGRPNWQQGLLVGSFINERFSLTPLYMSRKHDLLYNGKLFDGIR